MKELLETFSLEQIIIFIVLLAIAAKGALSWWDWISDRINKKMTKKQEKEQLRERLETAIEELKKSQTKMESEMQYVTKSIQILMDSDKDDIKAWITMQHHYFCYELGYIDDYNLDCLEKRYTHYEDEGGNSFVHELMEEIRALPKRNGANLYQQRISGDRDSETH